MAAEGQQPREYGMRRGKVFPSSKAASLLNPLRRVLQSPRRTARAARIDPRDRVLEVGCGPGYFSPEMCDACSPGVFVALDLQPGMLMHARRRLAGRDGVGMVAADAMVLPFTDASFDVVFVATMLGEVPDVSAAIREVRRVLVPDGTASFAETRRDSDFIPLSRLQPLVEPAGFELTARRGPPWQYVANFSAVPMSS